MTEPQAGNALAAAWRRLSVSLLLRLGCGTVILTVLGFAWLQIPDSHAWEFAVSVVSAVVLVIADLGLWGWGLARFRRLPLRWYRCVWLVVFLGVAWLMLLPIAAGREHEELFAGYWNSKMHFQTRFYLTYVRMVRWQDHFYDFAQWVTAALVVPLAMETVACGFGAASLRHAARVYRRWLFWVVTLGLGWAAYALTGALAGWMPLHGLRGEAISVVLRFGAAFVADLVLVGFVLALTGVYLERGAASREMDGQVAKGIG